MLQSYFYVLKINKSKNLPESRKKIVACIFVEISQMTIVAGRLDRSRNRAQRMVIYMMNLFLFIGQYFHLENIRTTKVNGLSLTTKKSMKRLDNFLILLLG